MKLLYCTILIIVISLASCNDSTESETRVTFIKDSTKIKLDSALSTSSADSGELTMFIRDVYKWKEMKSSTYDFYPISDNHDSMYIGIDWNQQAKRQNELKATGYFSKEFLDNYRNIAQTIDNKLKHGSYSWPVGELPPFGNDANPWCNCQDYPDDYWKMITVSKIETINGDASFVWTFNNKRFYKVVATKIDGSWKIKYLDGFDYKKFLL